jgi:hypothetical protein
LERFRSRSDCFRNDEFELKELEPLKKFSIIARIRIPDEAGLQRLLKHAENKSILGCLGLQAVEKFWWNANQF